MAANSLETDPLLSFGTPVDDPLATTPIAAAPAPAPAPTTVSSGQPEEFGLSYGTDVRPVDDLINEQALAPVAEPSTVAAAPTDAGASDELIVAPVGPVLSGTRFGSYLATNAQFADFASVDAALSDPDSDFDLEDMLNDAARVQASRIAAQNNISPSSTAYRRTVENLAVTIAADMGAEFTPQLAQYRQSLVQAAAAAEPDAQRAAEKQDQVGFFEQTFAYLGAGGLSALAGTADMANFVLSSFGDADAEALDIEFLRDASGAIREGSQELLANNTSEAFTRQQAELDAIVNSDVGAGAKVVQLTGSLLDGDGMSFASAMLAQSVGYLAVSLVGAKGASAGAKGALRSTSALTPKAGRAASTMVAAAGQNVAAGRLATVANRVGLGAAVALPAAGSSIQESVDEIETMAREKPEALRQLPGWKAAQASLTIELGHAPTDQQTLNRFSRRVAGTSGAIAGGITLAGTVFAPFSERALRSLMTTRSVGTVGTGTTLKRAAGLGTLEAVSEGAEEFAQTVAGDVALRTVGSGQAIGSALEDASTPDAQLAAYLGAVLGLGAGAGLAIASKPDPLRDTPAASDKLPVVEAVDGAAPTAPDTSAAPDSGGGDASNASSDLSAEAVQVQAAQSFVAARAASVNALSTDHGVQVSENAIMGLDENHGVFAAGNGVVSGGTFTPFFSDGNRAIGVDRSTGSVAYAVNTSEGVVWSADPKGVSGMGDLIEATDAIQITAAVDGSEINAELATLYGRRRDAVTRTVTVVDELATLDPVAEADATAADVEPVAIIREANTAAAVSAAFEKSKFGGLVSLDGDPRLDEASSNTYIAATRARLNRRAAWYDQVMGSRRKLGETVTLRMEGSDLPVNSVQSEAVRAFIAKVVATPAGEREALADTVAFDERQSAGARGAAREVQGMLRAARTIDQVLYTKARTARVLTAKTASEAVTSVATLDPLAAQGDVRKTSTLFETTDVSTFDEGPSRGSLDVALETPVTESPTETTDRVVDAVSTSPASTEVGHVAPFVVAQSSSTGQVLRRLLRSRLAARGEYTAMLSQNPRQVTDAALAFDVNTLSAIDQGMDTAMAGYASARMEQGVSNETLAREIVHVGGVGPARAKAIIARARTIGPADAPVVQTAALEQVDQLVRNAVAEEVFDTPIDATELDTLVRDTNRRQSGNNIHLEWFESLEAYRAGIVNARLETLESATVENIAALSARVRAEFPVVGASAMFIKGADGKKDRVVLLRDRFENVEAVDRVIQHEMVAHYGLRRMLTEDGIADISEQILRSDDKTIRNLVNATRRKLVRARVAARRAEYTVNGATPPTNLEQEMEREINHDGFRAVLGEEVLAEAVEQGYGKDLAKKGPAARVIDLVRKIFSNRSGLEVRTIDDMASLLHAARQASGLENSRMNHNYTPTRSDLTGGGFNLHWFEKFRDTVFDEEAAIHRVAAVASLPEFGLDREANRLSDGIVHAAGLARRRTSEVQGLYLTPAVSRLEEVRARLGMNHKEFYADFDQLMYLRHSKERIKGLAFMYGTMTDPNNAALRAQIIEEAKSTTDDARLAELSAEMYAINDTALDKVRNEDPSFGRHLVGRTYAEIDEDLAGLEDSGFAAAIDELNLSGPDGLLRQATEAVLQNRRSSNYGDSGYALTRLFGWQNYVPMGQYDGTDTGDGGDAEILRLKYDTLLPSASRLAALEGSAAVPRMSVVMQLMAAAQRSSKDMVSNDINRAFAEIALVERTTVDDGGLATTTLAAREGLEFLLEDDIRPAVAYAEVGGDLFGMRAKYGKERVQLAWRQDGSADIYAIKDTRLANAFNSRVREDFPTGSTGAAVGRTLQKVTRVQGRLLTSYNPLFVAFRQFPRDLAQAMVQAGFEQNLGTGGTFGVARKTFGYLPAMERFFLSDAAAREVSLKEWRADSKHPMHSFAKRADLGGVTFFEQQFRDPAEGPTFVEGGTAGARVLRGGRRAGEVIESLSNAADNAVRQALFDQVVAVESAKPEGERRGTQEEIEVYANDVATQTMNFSQRSSIGRFGSMLHPFVQTALTGTDAVLTRRMWKNGTIPTEPVRQPDGSYRTQLKDGWAKELNVPLMTVLGGIGIASTLAAFAAVQAGLGDDDPDVGSQLRPTTLMRSYFMPGFERPLQVSVQPGLMGAVHATGAAVTMIAAGHHDTQAVTRAWRDSMIYNLTPLNSALGGEFTVDTMVDNLIPTLLQPILQHASNKDAFGNSLTSQSFDTGEAEGVSTLYPRPSMPLVYERLANEWRETAQAMGMDNVDPSPELIRHYMRGWSGGVGQTFDKAMKILQATNDGDPVSTTDAALEFTGLQATDPKFAHYNQYFTLVDNTITPMMVEYRRARKADIVSGAVSSSFRLGQQPGPAMADVFARYGGSIREISRVSGRLRKAAGLLKKDLYIARNAGVTSDIQRTKGEIEDLYLNGALEMRSILDAAGVTY